ncbi:FAD-binding oxidoreductase [Commensalibacter melissae]|uniref:FAD-binding oxidoreductase n=1 Tax=Commensalibacter melissae TaxID=2070537 RepID=UPI000EFB1CD3|nr:FAD-binding oxidoreductase [Commensalibacter melissae]AYN87198.1 FAD-binding oxidoreductase [Commensalibacter melissae]
MDNSDFINNLTSILDTQGIITDPKEKISYDTDWREIFHANSLAVVRPKTTEQVAEIVKLCNDYQIAIVPQGGNTSLVGGASPTPDKKQIVLSLNHMNKIRDINTIDYTMTVEAGLVLEEAQNIALKSDLYLPIMISSQGSAQIGGIIATNAGGNNTLRYGNTREFILGLEVVTAKGKILNILRHLRKDNTGYDLKQLFIGSEGTLGIITAAVIQLHAKPKSTEVALCALTDIHQALKLLRLFHNYNPAALQAFEYISSTGMQLVRSNIEDIYFPLETETSTYILVELALPEKGDKLKALLETVLEEAFEKGIVLDAVLAESETQRQNLWKLREEQAESQKRAGANIKNDVSVPISAIPEFIVRATQACQETYPGIRVAPFGHLGDGNIHFNLVQPEHEDPDEFIQKSHNLMNIVSKIVFDLHGSFSAEHGVGQLKNYMMSEWKSETELDLMQKIKKALDPDNLLNPGKIFPKS